MEPENNLIIVTCRCGAIIPDDNIDDRNGCNEEGEEFGTVTANCDKCGHDYETSQWGEWTDLEEAKGYLQEYINDTGNLYSKEA
jgi:hypothetical protein